MVLGPLPMASRDYTGLENISGWIIPDDKPVLMSKMSDFGGD